MSDSPFSIDFASIKSQAGELLDAVDTEVPDVVAEAAPAVEAAAPEAGPSATSPTPQASPAEELDPEVHGDRLVRVKVDGQWEVKSLKDVASGYSRTSHFTRQMQDVATKRREADELLAQHTARQSELTAQQNELQQLRSLVGNKELLIKYVQHLGGQPNPPVEGDPNEIATVQQARDISAAQVKQFQQSLEELEQRQTARVAASARDIENRRETAVFSESINTTVKEIFEASPILTAIPNIEDLIRYQVHQLNPKTLTEANEAFRTVAKGMVEDLHAKFTDHNKLKLATATKLSKARIEPPGGSGIQVQPVKQAYDKESGAMNWKSLNAAATNMMTD